MRNDEDITEAIKLHGDTVWRVCLFRLGSRGYAQDAFQDVFLSYATHDSVRFESEEHRKAWLIRVATNRCASICRVAERLDPLDASYEQTESLALDEQPDAALWEVTQAMENLRPEHRQAVYLTVCEGYSAAEAAAIMEVSVNTLYSWIARGKKRLREVLSQ